MGRDRESEKRRAELNDPGRDGSGGVVRRRLQIADWQIELGARGEEKGRTGRTGQQRVGSF
jgi:hypothetical protein